MRCQYVAIIFLLFAVYNVQAEAKHFDLDGFLVVEDVTNFHGGIRNGSVFNGIYHPIVEYNFLNASHAQARVGMLAITYTQSQQNYTGASQNVSNLSAQRMVRLAELNYAQDINKYANIRVGLMDIREYLNCYDLPKELINSGFGTNRVMGGSSAVPTYPYPGFGALLTLQPAANYGLGIAVFQGDPQHQSTVFHHGIFILEEANWNTILPTKLKPTLYLKLGFWQYQQPDHSIGFSNIGTYLMAQGVWFNKHQRQFNIYAQIGYGPDQDNVLPYSVTAGIAARGVLPQRSNDFLSFGISQIWLRNAKCETVFELGYKYVFWEHFYLKPDLQYIVNPNGTLPNAFAGILRLVYNLDGHLLQKH
jgi:porin